MARPIVECVPNFSEGRDAGKIDAIVDAIRSRPGVAVLDRESDEDHNRSVVTFVGPPEEVLEAALAGIGKAVELIDLTRHTGVHPRVGAADVVPFVPIEGVTLEECVGLAHRAGEAIWRRYGVPVYFYEAAALREDRVNLANIRRGQFEGLREDVRSHPERRPDVGGPELHATAGATVVGARKFLIAYNINLGTPDVAVAKRIAKVVRFSSGGLPCVKAMGVKLEARNLAQVSMNLTDFEQTPMHQVFEAVKREAAREGVAVVGSEIVGLVPKKALEMASEFFLQIENFQPGLVLENRMMEAAGEGVLGGFLEELAAPTPGGGSAVAAAGVMAAALGEMIARIAKLEGYDFSADRALLAAAVARDAAAYRAVIAASRLPGNERGTWVEQALKEAATVPMEVAEAATRVRTALAKLASEVPPKLAADLETATALAEAARTGAMASVRSNLESMQDAEFRESLVERLREIS
jgi:glutamate formiminotransferase / formiminotetrahydrofolate cyclodeaminase